ncbi:splicing factor U2af large subunit B-like [Lactuca sativa]|uniref:splicing factor U2af large subunit B-like n=1 Tax=Lactuca sativa TaxID=4236 RepID=UPI0022B00394|nr:splicing factor U2af large subunit B-like [Lactuca sativa]
MLRRSSHHRSSPKDGIRSDRDKQRGTRETRDIDRDKDRSREDINGKGRDKDRERERERDRGGDRDRERERVRVKREHRRERAPFSLNLASETVCRRRDLFPLGNEKDHLSKNEIRRVHSVRALGLSLKEKEAGNNTIAKSKES